MGIEHNLTRPDWDSYFMKIAKDVSERGNCCRRQVGAIIVVDKRIVTTGYNGTPKGAKNCFDGGCKRCAGESTRGQNYGECICCHAEENAIVQAAYHGISIKDSKIYCLLSPCLWCAKMIVNAGIVEVIYEHEYTHTDQVKELFDMCNVKYRQFSLRT